jgi:hypothetical protein
VKNPHLERQSKATQTKSLAILPKTAHLSLKYMPWDFMLLCFVFLKSLSLCYVHIRLF